MSRWLSQLSSVSSRSRTSSTAIAVSGVTATICDRVRHGGRGATTHRALVAAGADVLSVSESHHSLEDVYLELIDTDEAVVPPDIRPGPRGLAHLPSGPVEDPRPTGGRSAHREAPGGDVEQYVSQARMDMAPTYRADVTLWLPEAEARTQLADQLAESSLKAEGEDRCRWISSIDTLPWLTLRILRLGCSFDVHGPPELIEHLRDVALRVGSSLPADATR